VQTLRALPQRRIIIRWTPAYGALSKLSDELIVPNLDQDISSFTSGHQEIAKTIRDISQSSGSESELLTSLKERTPNCFKRIQAERQRNH